jgi:hypothetical protein
MTDVTPPMTFGPATKPTDLQGQIDALMKGPSWIFLGKDVLYLRRGHVLCTDIRMRLHANGYACIPVNGKIPNLTGWQKINADRATIVGWERARSHEVNTGLLTATTPTLDVDILDEKAVAAVEALIRKRFAERGHIMGRVGKPPKAAFPFRTDKTFSKITVILAPPGVDPTDETKWQRLEFLGDGQQFVVAGIHPDTEKPYQWNGGGSPITVKRDKLPTITEAEARALVDESVKLLCEQHGYVLAVKKEKPKADKQDAHHDTSYTRLNSHALANLDKWVPKLFPQATKRPDDKGWRVSSASLNRDLEEDISFSPQGIVDFGVHDMGDEREGKRTPIDIVMEWKTDDNLQDAVDWLCETLGYEFESPVVEDTVAITPIDLWGKFDPPALPLGLLPKTLERYATTQAEIMGVDPGGIAVAALTVCGAAIPDSIELQVKEHERGWTESARLWVALIGLPSTKKSPTLRVVSHALVRIDKDYYHTYVAAKQRYDNLSAEERRAAPKPVRQQIKLEDSTIEAAQEVLRHNTNGILCLQDELGGWFGSMDKYNSGKGAAKDRGFWLQSWNGGAYSVNRIARDSYLLENLSISILGGIQPDTLRAHVSDTLDDGLIQRVIPVVLQAGRADKDEPMPDVGLEYERLIDRLHELTPTFAAGWDNIGGRETRLVFDDEAQAIRRQVADKHLRLTGLEIINKKLAAHIGKYDSFFARLCIIWHCIEHAGTAVPRSITADTAERVAKFLHEFLLRHAFAFYANVLDLSDDHDRLEAVAGYILAHKLKRVTNRDMARGVRTMRKLTRRDTETVFEQLEALGWLFRKPAPRPTDPPHWEVNPEVHRLFEERAKEEVTRRAEVLELIKEAAEARRP